MSDVETELPIVVCASCGAERKGRPAKGGGAKTPKGWLSIGSDFFCGKCGKEQYALRSISIPIAEVLEPGTAQEFRDALKISWGRVTAASNWIVRELYRRDPDAQQRQEKLGKMPSFYLYPEIREAFPDITPQSVTMIEQAVTQTYRAQRFELVQTGSRQLATFRYPTPLPIPRQGYKLWKDGDRYLFRFRVGGRTWTVRLRSGSEFRRQIRALDQILAGEVIPTGAAVYRKTSRAGDHRPTPSFRTMLKIAGRFPVEGKTADGVLKVRTGPDSFLVAEGDAAPWILNGDHVRGWVATHARRRRRLSQDLKAEMRSPAVRRKGLVGKMGQRAIRDRDRLSTWSHEAAKMVVGYAVRNGCGRIEYDDSDKTFLPSYPWFRLAQLIGEKAHAAGVEFVSVSGVRGEGKENGGKSDED